MSATKPLVRTMHLSQSRGASPSLNRGSLVDGNWEGVPTKRATLAIPLLSCLLRLRMTKNDSKAAVRKSPFIQREKSNGATEFVQRLAKQTMCSPSCFVMAFLLIDRLFDSGLKTYEITSSTFRRLFTTSLVIASKFLDDNPGDNKCFSKAGELDVTILNALELKMLGDLDFCIFVSPQLFICYESGLYEEAMTSNSLASLHLKLKLVENGLIRRGGSQPSLAVYSDAS